MLFVVPMDAIRSLCRFADALEGLLASADALAFERAWREGDLDQVGWEALALGRRATGAGEAGAALERALAQVDRRLLAVLERGRAFLDPHLVTFRVPELERWQHAAAAALVGARWGVAGLRTILGPKILESLYVLCDPRSLPLFEQLLVTGHTDPDLERCEVTRALVAVRKLTGRLAPSSKFADAAEEVVQRTLDDAERRFE